jgi:hypothetical protein
MSDTGTTDTGVWPDRKLTDNQQRVRAAAELIPVGDQGAAPMNFAQQVDYANWMAKSGAAIPAHLRNNIGACLAVMEIAHKFGFPAYMVARQTYLVNDQIAFMGQLIMAIINMFCPLKERLKFRFEGEGPDLRCIVTGHIEGEVDAVEYRSPRIADIRVKNSPLWQTDPEQQFCYLAARRWQSRYWPEGLFGIYSPEDLAENPNLDAPRVGSANAKDVTPTPSLRERLRGPGGDGFAGAGIGQHIDAALNAARDPQHKPKSADKGEPPLAPAGDGPDAAPPADVEAGAGAVASASAPTLSDPPSTLVPQGNDDGRDGAVPAGPSPTSAGTADQKTADKADEPKGAQ